MHPKKLALIDDDKEYSEFLAQHLRGLGMQVSVYGDSNELLADADGFVHDFYLVDLMLPGVNGLELIKILRRRTDAGVLVVSGSVGPEVFKDVIAAGADMFLAKPVQFEQVALVIEAVQRRAGRTTSSAAWRLDRRAGELVAPDGARGAERPGPHGDGMFSRRPGRACAARELLETPGPRPGPGR